MLSSKTYIATPPGATIKELLDDRGMSQREFSVRMDTSEKHISRLINGEVRLTPNMAMRLEMVLGVPSRFWSNLEGIYREKLEKIQEENEMEEDLKLLKNFPYNEMAKHQWVENTRKPKERVFNLRKFFEIVRLSLLPEKEILSIAYRKLGENEKSYYTLLAWAQKAKLDAREIVTAPLNFKKLKENIPNFREMTTQNPSVFCDLLCEKLRECGVALVFLPHLGGSFLHGASFFDGEKLVLGLTVRGKDADIFWFSFFHELGHILMGHLNSSEGSPESKEEAADNFARNTLIKDEQFEAFVNLKGYNSQAIRAFAKEQGIDPGIVVGRMQKEKVIPHSYHNDLKTKYSLSL